MPPRGKGPVVSGVRDFLRVEFSARYFLIEMGQPFGALAHELYPSAAVVVTDCDAVPACGLKTRERHSRSSTDETAVFLGYFFTCMVDLCATRHVEGFTDVEGVCPWKLSGRELACCLGHRLWALRPCTCDLCDIAHSYLFPRRSALANRLHVPSSGEAHANHKCDVRGMFLLCVCLAACLDQNGDPVALLGQVQYRLCFESIKASGSIAGWWGACWIGQLRDRFQ